ncbi:MAG: hypothetical protein EBT22_14405 [Chloroflexi bacterium]|nr:hypothetical protein [Chloroflexota bacterium]
MRPIVKGTLPLALLLVLLYPVWSIMLRPDLDLWATEGETLAFPRWIPDLYRGYGYPVFNFYAPLTYLAGHLVTSTGLSVWSAFRILGLGAIVSGATGAYAVVRITSSRVTGNRDHTGAIAAGLLYLVAPYPFVTNLYIRADLPEALGLGSLVGLLPVAWWRSQQFRPSPKAQACNLPQCESRLAT